MIDILNLLFSILFASVFSLFYFHPMLLYLFLGFFLGLVLGTGLAVHDKLLLVAFNRLLHNPSNFSFPAWLCLYSHL